MDNNIVLLSESRNIVQDVKITQAKVRLRSEDVVTIRLFIRK